MTQKSYTEAELIEVLIFPVVIFLTFSTNMSVSVSLLGILLYLTLFTDITILNICPISRI